MACATVEDSGSNLGGPFEQQIAASYGIFTHRPLDLSRQTIRLIRVLPTLSPAGRVQCALWHDRLPASYTCLSYTWGSTTKYYVININGQGFTVRENLWHFLDSARKLLPNQPLWIDAVCIDQASTLERNHQVRQMGQLYNNANSVIVWIKALDTAVGFLQANAHCKRLPKTHTIKAEVIQSLVDLCTDEYWQRTWIVQEILLAKQLHLMTQSIKISWEDLTDFILNQHTAASSFTLRDIDEDSLAIIKASQAAVLCNERAVSSGQMFQYSLLDLLHKFGKSRCSDVRDRVLGFLGLSELSKHDQFHVDYAMNTAELARLVIRHCTANTIDDIRKVVDGLDLSLQDLVQLTTDLPSMSVKSASVKAMIQGKGDLLQCCYCNSRLRFVEVGSKSPSSRRVPPNWWLDGRALASLHKDYPEMVADFGPSETAICCLADYGIAAHFGFEPYAKYHMNLYLSLPTGVFLPDDLPVDEEECLPQLPGSFRLEVGPTGRGWRLRPDRDSILFLLYGTQQRMLLPIPQRSLYDTLGVKNNIEAQRGAEPSQKALMDPIQSSDGGGPLARSFLRQSRFLQYIQCC